MASVYRNPRAQMFLQMLATVAVGFGIWEISGYLAAEVSGGVLRAIDPPGTLLPLAFGIAVLTGLPLLLCLPLQGVLRERVASAHLPLIALLLLALTVYHIALRNNYRP